MSRTLARTLAGVALSTAILTAQAGSMFRSSRDHAAIQYSTAATHDAVAALNQRIQNGETRLAFEAPGGYLKSVLAALGVSAASQTLV